jgi:hypothetical protein
MVERCGASRTGPALRSPNAACPGFSRGLPRLSRAFYGGNSRGLPYVLCGAFLIGDGGSSGPGGDINSTMLDLVSSR